MIDWKPPLAKLGQVHGGPASWPLTRAGLAIGAAEPIGTPAPPATALRVWNWFGAEILAAARAHDVPVELLVATICTESAGGHTDRAAVCAARREEPDFVSDQDTRWRVSVGCMQTLIATAEIVLRRPVVAAELEDPAARSMPARGGSPATGA